MRVVATGRLVCMCAVVAGQGGPPRLDTGMAAETLVSACCQTGTWCAREASDVSRSPEQEPRQLARPTVSLDTSLR